MVAFRYTIGERVVFRHIGERVGKPMVVESLHGGDGWPCYVLVAPPGAAPCRIVGASENNLTREGESNAESERACLALAAQRARSAFLALGHWRDQRTDFARRRWQELRNQSDIAASHLERLMQADLFRKGRAA